jgi:hypothetical protein
LNPTLLDDPMVQAGIAPLLAALAVGGALLATRWSWLAIAAALATTFALSTGIGFTPLSASRKIMLLVLLAPLAGLALDALERAGRLPRGRASTVGVAVLAGLAAAWVFQSVLAQREGLLAWALGAVVAAFVALLVGLSVRLRDDGAAAGSAALGLGLAVGVSAILSASLGNTMNGFGLAAGAGALLLLQFTRGRALVPGWTGTLTVGLAAALFAAATLVLAEARWYALALLLLVPMAAALPIFGQHALRQRLLRLVPSCVVVAAAAILAAWLATRFPSS